MNRRAGIGLVVAIAGVLLFVMTFVFDARYRKVHYARSGWPTTQGTVVASTTHYNGDDQLDVTVEFGYQIGNVRYANRQDWAVGTDKYLVGKEMDKARSNYPLGKIVAVYYNPTNPAESVIEPRDFVHDIGLSLLFQVTFAGGLFLAVLGTVTVRQALRGRA